MGFIVGQALLGGSPDYAGMAQQQEQKRQQAITEGTAAIDKAYSGFTPGFYQQRVKAYEDFALPQLSQQYQANRNQIGFGLANRGLQASGTASKQWTDLGKAMGQAKQNIVDQGIAQSQQLQQQVEGQRNTLLSQLYQSADPASANAAATNTAANFAAPSAFPALGNMFSGLANTYYLSQLMNTYRPGGSSPQIAAAPSYYQSYSGALPGTTYN